MGRSSVEISLSLRDISYVNGRLRINFVARRWIRSVCLTIDRLRGPDLSSVPRAGRTMAKYKVRRIFSLGYSVVDICRNPNILHVGRCTLVKSVFRPCQVIVIPVTQMPRCFSSGVTASVLFLIVYKEFGDSLSW